MLDGAEVTASELLKLLQTSSYGDNDKAAVVEYLSSHVRKVMNAKSIGRVLNIRRDRPANGLKLTVRPNRAKIDTYSVKPAGSAYAEVT